MECNECGAILRLMVDDVWMSEDALHALKRPPKKIEYIMYHQVWCTKNRDLIHHSRR